MRAEEGEYSQLNGANFHSELRLKDNQLKISVTSLKKRDFFTTTITNAILQKQYRRYMIFKKVGDLYQELISNQNIEMNDENALLIPVDVIYRGKHFQLTVQLSLDIKIFNSEAEKFQNLFDLLQKLNSQKMKIQKQFRDKIFPGKNQKQNQIPRQNLNECINFKGDETGQYFKMYQFSDFNRKVKKVGDGHKILNHCQKIPQKGVHSLKVQILKSTKKAILIGICTNLEKSMIYPHKSSSFLALALNNGKIYTNGGHIQIGRKINVKEGSIVKVEIDMDKKIVQWYQEEVFLFQIVIPKLIEKAGFYPMISIDNHGDILEFLKK